MLKSFIAYIVVDWRNNNQKLNMRKPVLKPYEVAVRIEYKINKPEPTIPTFSLAQINIPQAVVDKVEGNSVVPNVTETT